MNRFRKKWSAIMVSVICLLTLLFAVPAYAAPKEEIDPQIKEYVELGVTEFVEEVYDYSDADLKMLRDEGGFYETMADEIEKNEAELGELVSVNSAEAELGENDHIVCTLQCSFENYDAQIMVYLKDNGATLSNYMVSIDYPLGKKMKQAASNTVIGIVIVFAVLLFLAFVISLFKYINPKARAQMKAKKEAQNKAPEPVVEQVQAKEVVPAAAVAETSDDEEIVAVIAAAIAAAEAEGGKGGYVVQSVRKVRSYKKWDRA